TAGFARSDGTSWDVFTPDIAAWAKQSTTVASLAAYNWYPAIVGADGFVEYVAGAFTSTDLLTVLGVAPEKGRWFTAEEAAQKARLAGITHDLWQRDFGGPPDIIGRPLKIYGDPRPIVGVLPAGLGLPVRTQFWLPSAATPSG